MMKQHSAVPTPILIDFGGSFIRHHPVDFPSRVTWTSGFAHPRYIVRDFSCFGLEVCDYFALAMSLFALKYRLHQTSQPCKGITFVTFLNILHFVVLFARCIYPRFCEEDSGAS